MSDDDLKRLCAGYRASIEDPPYDAADAALLRVAAQRARHFPMRRLAYGIAAALVAGLGVAVGLRSMTPSRKPSTVPAHEATALSEARSARTQSPAFANYLTPATLGSAHSGRPDYAEATAPLARGSHPVSLRRPGTGLACGPSAEVDLNAPGVLAGLEATNPDDYARIMGIITGLTQHPDLDVARWIATSFHARGVSYFPLWQTSLPPKRLLSFCLDSTRYRVVLSITSNGAQVTDMTHGEPPR